MKTRPLVLYATDLAGDVVKGLRVASRAAEQRAGRLLVVHVVPLRTSDGEGMLHAAVDLLSSQRDRDLRALTRAPSSVPHRTLLRVGDPEEELARVADETGASLVVMEARPRSALRRLLLGRSLVERLSARVDCPVVTYEPGGCDSDTAPTAELDGRPSPSRALQAVLDARVDAVVEWLDARAHAGTSVARRPSIVHAVASLAASARWPCRTDSARQIRDELVLELGEHLQTTGAVGVQIWLDDGRGGIDLPPFSDSGLLLSLGVDACPGLERDAWIGAVMRDGAAVSLPIDATDPEEPPVVLAGARIPLAGGAAAALVFVFDARPGFLQVLAQPGPSSSAETYAFDEKGLMLSNSRFPAQLRRAGLLAPSSRAARRVRVADPGICLLDSSPSDAMETWPLTRMAASATAGNDGVDVRGYRDYRGVPVIGAWRWIPCHGFGIAAEMDVREAHEMSFGRAS